jgi:hypothetical protein
MIDFTFKTFEELLKVFQKENYKIQTVSSFLQEPESKVLILRHDVDRYPNNALRMAEMEAELGIKASYYFRIVPSVYKEEIIKAVRDLGHEVSYHYEDLSLNGGDFEKAIEHFKFHLEKFRNFSAAITICRHGSPLSKWDNKRLWEKYHYQDFGIIGDTEFDIDYNKVFYISDNGMGWNKTSTSIRDKVDSIFDIPIKGTEHLIKLIKSGKLPDQIAMNAHPDTFFDFGIRWIINASMIKVKNIVKWVIVKAKLLS